MADRLSKSHDDGLDTCVAVAEEMVAETIALAQAGGMLGLDLSALSLPNRARARKWHEGMEPWSGADWSNAMLGEAGEAANVVKKLRRLETGARGNRVNEQDVNNLREKLAVELADVVIYMDLLCAHYSLDLVAAIKSKFDEVSEKQGFPERIGVTE